MISVETDERAMRDLHAALMREGNGARFRTDLAGRIGDALAPAVPMLRAELHSLTGPALTPHAGEPIRQAVARQIVVDVRTHGRASGAYVRVLRQGMPRGFANAPKRLNSRGGWRHPVFGSGRWVRQLGAPGWFDRPLEMRRPAYRAAVIDAMRAMSRRIVRRA